MPKSFYLSVDTKHVGPFNHEDILNKIKAKSVSWMDYLYDEHVKDWVLILEHPDFTEKFNAGWGRPGAEPIVVEHKPFRNPANKHIEKEWYLLRDQNNYGPYSLVEVIQMLQEKTLFEFDYVWCQDLPAWKRVAEVPELSTDAIKDLYSANDGQWSEIFFRRRHARAHYGCSLIVHDNKNVYKGHSVEISTGGAGVVIPSLALQPGQTLFLHFQPGDGVPPFNAICHVVSKQFVKITPQNPAVESVKYGVKFTSISQSVRDSIKTFTDKKAA